MIRNPKSIGALLLRLIVGLALLGWPRVGAAQGTWSVISLPPQPSDLVSPGAVAVDTAGNLYVADQRHGLQKRDAQGNWSPITTYGPASGQLQASPALAVDGTGNLYVADSTGTASGRIQKRDAQGNWSVIASSGDGLGQIEFYVAGLAVDAVGSLYVADWGRIQKRDAQGHGSVIATQGAFGLAVDAAGNLYVRKNGIQKRDAQGRWSTLTAPGASSLAVDTAGNLYVSDGFRVHKRDALGKWSAVTTVYGDAPGQVAPSSALAADNTGNLYVAGGNNGARIQKRDAQGNWSILDTNHSGLLAVDTAGTLYVLDEYEIQKRDGQGNWWVIAAPGYDLGQVLKLSALAVDDHASRGAPGNLYVADQVRPQREGCGGPLPPYARIQKRDPQGRWSEVSAEGLDSGFGRDVFALAVDTAGTLYVASWYGDVNNAHHRINRRDAQGNWLWIAGPYEYITALAVDTAGNLYVADSGRIRKRDAQGNWSVIAYDAALGQVSPAALAVDGAGNLYVTDTFNFNNNRLLKYTPHP